MLVVVHSVKIWLEQTQTWVYTQVEHLPKDRVESHVVCIGTRNLEQFSVPRVHSLEQHSRLVRLWQLGLQRVGVRHSLGLLSSVSLKVGARLIHSHFGDVGWADRGAVRRARARHVVTFYGYDVSYLPLQPGWQKRLRQLFASADRFLCEGSHMKQRLTAIGCPENKIAVHHLGVRLEQLPFRPRTWRQGEALRVLIAGAFSEKKGIPLALEALGRVKRGVDLEVTIIGDARANVAESVAEKQKILATIARHGLASRVRLLGYCPHSVMIEEAYRHHLFLSPSVTASNGATEGGAPVSIIEMAATGMPIVSTRHCDIPEVVQDRVTGMLADERDVEGLVGCIEALLAEPDSWASMLNAGRRRVEQEYSALTQGQRLACIYEEIVG